MLHQILATILTYTQIAFNWLENTFGLPESISFLRYFIASWYAISLLTISIWVFLVWRYSKYLYYFYLYIFIIGLTLIGFRSIIEINIAWLLGVVLIICSLIFIISTQISKKTSPFAKKILRRFYLFGFIFSLILPFLLYWQQNDYTVNPELQQQDQRLTEDINFLKDKLHKQADKANQISESPEIMLSFSEKISDRTARLRYISQQNDLDFIIITDPLANRIGDSSENINAPANYFETYNWTRTLFTANEGIDYIVQDDRQQPIMVSARAVNYESKKIGYIFIGQNLNTDYLRRNFKTDNRAIFNQKGIIAYQSDKTSTTSLYNTNNFSQKIKTALKDVTSPKKNLLVDYKEQIFRVTAYSMNQFGPISGNQLWLITTNITSNSQSISWLVIILTIIISITLVATLSFIKHTFVKTFEYKTKNKFEDIPLNHKEIELKEVDIPEDKKL